MALHTNQAFVRAKPGKISLTETYRYKAEISDYTSMSFTEAGGEIKVEFVYDGELCDFRWKLRVFWESLFKKWGVLKWLRKWFQKFLNGNIFDP